MTIGDMFFCILLHFYWFDMGILTADRPSIERDWQKIRQLALFVTKRKLRPLIIKIRNLAPYLSHRQNPSSYGTMYLKYNKLNSFDMLKFNAINNNFSKLYLVTSINPIRFLNFQLCVQAQIIIVRAKTHKSETTLENAHNSSGIYNWIKIF